MKRLLLAIAGASALLYAADWLILHARSKPRGSVEVQRYYAVTLKDRKTEYYFDEPQTQTCVHAIFPHSGEPPCWYLERHKQQRIDIQSSPVRGF
ncbi:MAG: hypothetical protein LAQ30_31320 [Acidobacteriia bacterium]|nr:hypothetical protein [Terriglobia bacterium]